MEADDESKSVNEAKNKNSTLQTTCRLPDLPRLTIEEAFNDYLGRRSAIIKALTTDVDELLRQCDPEKPEVCLYGLQDGEWKVEPPVELLPSDKPEPTAGINWGRTHTELDEWLLYVALHSEAWLISFALHSSQNRSDRENLFKMINELPTVTDVVDQFVTTNEELKFREGFKNKHFTTVTEAESTPLVAAETVEEVFKDFAGRRAAIVKALTTDVEEFVRQISEREKEKCLYGHADGEWELREATNGEMTCRNRDPTVGINFGIEGIPLIQWLRLVAIHSDAWLISTAFHNPSHTHFRKLDRERLFDMINDLPTRNTRKKSFGFVVIIVRLGIMVNV
ncbi:unnamed protein product [Citrullus colocynthis]|uniref:PHD finger protein ALFIN-LIKE n=1 Tax=Citrullus colocynthis TaxID=252529 RepID=A0ABP0Z679_9ROSI